MQGAVHVLHGQAFSTLSLFTLPILLLDPEQAMGQWEGRRAKDIILKKIITKECI